MKFCDITIAYNEKSGGIRTYLDEKRRFLAERTGHGHLLIVPGEEDSLTTDAHGAIATIAAPLLPNQSDYRMFVSRAKIRDVLERHQPDIVELGSYYIEPWAAFSYRRRRVKAGADCLVGSYFHTDVAQAYVGGPLRAKAHDLLEDVSDTLTSAAERIAEIVARRVEHYMRSVFEHCDVVVAPSPAQARRLRDYGVERAEVVPLGVDLTLFNPAKRHTDVRRALGAGDDCVALIYAGRLSTEKRVSLLVDALSLLPCELPTQLWMVGDGPLRGDIAAAAARDPRIQLLDYEQDRARFARLLASADLYVTAGPHETFALSVIEAQACGLPVVGVAAGALPERVPQGLGFLAEVDDAADMAAQIVRAARDRSALGARARAHVERHFSWDGTFTTLMSCYERALDRSQQRVAALGA